MFAPALHFLTKHNGGMLLIMQSKRMLQIILSMSLTGKSEHVKIILHILTAFHL